MFLQITGTGHGIGKELALRYASLGATVVCWDVNQESNEETVNEIKKTGTAAAYAYQYVYIVYSFTKCNKTERNIIVKHPIEKLSRKIQECSHLVSQMRRVEQRSCLQCSRKSQAGSWQRHYFS